MILAAALALVVAAVVVAVWGQWRSRDELDWYHTRQTALRLAVSGFFLAAVSLFPRWLGGAYNHGPLLWGAVAGAALAAALGVLRFIARGWRTLTWAGSRRSW